MSERQSPGFARMKKNLGPDAAERLRLDTVRLQEEALRSIREPVKPRKKAGPEHLNKIINKKDGTSLVRTSDGKVLANLSKKYHIEGK